jgi:signal transduction histidine kinase
MPPSPSFPSSPTNASDPPARGGAGDRPRLTLLGRYRGSFTTKLSFLILLLSLMPLVAMTAVVVRLSTHALQADAYEMVQLMRNAAADKSAMYLTERANDVEGWSRHVLLGNSADSLAYKSQLLARVVAINPSYRWLALIDEAGHVTAAAGPHPPSAPVARAPWFTRQRPAVSGVVWDGDEPTIVYMVPMAAEKSTLVAVADLGVIQEVVRSARIRGSGETYLLTQAGRLISESRFQRTASQARTIHTAGQQAASQGRTGVAVYRDYRGVEVVGAYGTVELPWGGPRSPKWIILSEVDVGEAMAPVRRLVGVVGAFVSGLVLLLSALIFYASRRISRPLRALDEAAQELAMGHLDRRVPAANDDEFGRVATTFNRMADRLEHHVVSLQALTTKLQELDRFRTDYIHAISHDLRTPLTVIQGYVEMLDDSMADQDGSSQRAYTDQIERATRRIQRMVDDLLDAARLEAGTFHLALEDIDLGALLQASTDALRPAAEEAGLHLTLERPDGPLMARADRERIERVVVNLVGNAVKFTPEGGDIRVTVARAGDAIRCEVTDTGEGIAAADLPRLFQRFSQLESGQRKRGSTGLGLSIAKAIVEAHGGAIGVTSIEGRGSTFWFTLPAVSPSRGEP